MTFDYGNVRGEPRNLALQPIFDAKCLSCHDGDPNKPGNNTYTVTDKTTKAMQTFTFDLRGQKLPIVVGEKPYADFTASYVSLAGVGIALGEDQVQITGNAKVYIEPGNAAKSEVVKKLNPPQRFPSFDGNVRAFPGKSHPADVGGRELTPEEYYLLILNIDMGGQYYFRENRPYK
jgi:hypothetical protein